MLCTGKLRQKILRADIGKTKAVNLVFGASRNDAPAQFVVSDLMVGVYVHVNEWNSLVIP
jgi:hypothetical protein